MAAKLRHVSNRENTFNMVIIRFVSCFFFTTNSEIVTISTACDSKMWRYFGNLTFLCYLCIKFSIRNENKGDSGCP